MSFIDAAAYVIGYVVLVYMAFTVLLATYIALDCVIPHSWKTDLRWKLTKKELVMYRSKGTATEYRLGWLIKSRLYAGGYYVASHDRKEATSIQYLEIVKFKPRSYVGKVPGKTR